MKKNFAKRFFIFGIIFLSIFTITLTSCSSSNKVKPLNQNAKNYEISGENGSYMFYSLGKNFFNDNNVYLTIFLYHMAYFLTSNYYYGIQRLKHYYLLIT